MEFEFVKDQRSAKIKVIGVGGAGNNAIDNMITSGLKGVAFIAANTDLQDLESSLAPIKLQLGAELTKGLGCGADPEVGRAAAMEDLERIKEVLSDSDMIFITAGMGGGTGTGAAPVIAECLKELKDPPLTVAVVTKPFLFEGGRRARQAVEGIERLKQSADTIITIPNDRLMSMAPRGCNIKDAFKMADDVLLQAVRGVSDLILLNGYVNVDFNDCRNIMANRGHALMGTGLAAGPDRAKMAAQAAVNSPLLEDASIQGAQGILINISSSENNVTLEEVHDACNLIQKDAHPDANVIFGVAWDNGLEDKLRITVIATGIGNKEQLAALPRLEERAHLATLDEVARNTRYYERPTRERRPRTESRPGPVERPPFSKYENFGSDEEDLERPTFMRKNAD
ncbi:MAG: cell division protein FtsZ [Thermodesulfobacteriota bacterium]